MCMSQKINCVTKISKIKQIPTKNTIMLTLLFTILLTFTQSGKIVTPAGPPGGSQGGRRLLQNTAVPLPTATEAANGAGNAAGAGGGATEMECMLSNKDP
eukprot:391322_1